MAGALAALAAVVALAACTAEEAADTSEPEPDPPAAETEPPAAETDPPPSAPPRPRAVVDRVVDGDTIRLADGRSVRLVQIDAPEVGEGECHSAASARTLVRLLPAGTRVGLEADPRLDRVDRFGRLLRTVHKGGLNVNLELVRRGAAAPWFFEGDRGRHADRLLAAARRARAAGRGLWGACPGTRLDPERAVETNAPPRAAAGGCDPSYPDVCIPPPPPDLDCADVRFRDFRVVAPDPHRFDGGGDGRGCEER